MHMYVYQVRGVLCSVHCMLQRDPYVVSVLNFSWERGVGVVKNNAI